MNQHQIPDMKRPAVNSAGRFIYFAASKWTLSGLKLR